MTVHPDDISVRVLRGRARVTDIITWFTDPFLFLTLWETSPLAWIYVQNTFFFFIIENRWRQAWTRVLWKTLQRFSSTSTKWARTNFSVFSILCGASLKMTNIFEADVCGSFDCTSSSSLRSRQLWARACKFDFHLKSFLLLTKLHRTSPFGFFCFV